MSSHKSIRRVLVEIFFIALLTGCQPPLPPPPEITTSSSLPTAILGQDYSVALKASQGEPPLVWAGDPPAGLKLDPHSGTITGKPEREGTFSFAVTMKDSARRSDTKIFKLIITPDVPLAITTASLLPDALEGQRYSETLEAIGARGQLNWSSGNLADDFTLSRIIGGIEGTPARPGMFTFDVKVTDGADQCATKRFVLTVVGILNITTASPLTQGKVGQVGYSQALQAARGKHPLKWSVSSGSLPRGLNLDEQRGLISGMPSTAGTFEFDVTVTDSMSPPQSATKHFQLRIDEPSTGARTILINGRQDGGLRWTFKIGDQALEDPGANGVAEINVRPGDTIEWHSEVGFHGVTFEQSADADRFLEFLPGGEALMAQDPGTFGPNNKGTNGFTGPRLLARARVKDQASLQELTFTCTVHGSNIPGDLTMDGRLVK